MNNQKKATENLTPIQLENIFNQALSDISLANTEQEKIALIAQFIENTFYLPEDLTYSFYCQMTGMFLFLTAGFQPDSVPPEELKSYLEICLNLYHRLPNKIDWILYKESLSNLLFNLAISYFYLGELEEGYRTLLRKKLIEEQGKAESPMRLFEVTVRLPAVDFQEIKKSCNSNHEMLFKLFNLLPDRNRFVSEKEQLQQSWENFEGESSDSIYCCLVERKGLLQTPTGARLVLLEGHGRRQVVSDGRNLFYFYNASPFQKDEIYHLASDALEAADFAAKDYFNLELPVCALSFSFAEKRFLYSGQSLGLPLALLTLSQKLLINRHRFFFSYKKEATFSGKIDLNGQILRIDPDALELKVKAAFYSGLRYLVVPTANLKEANIFLYKLLSIHPWRKLEIIGASSLKEILEDNRLSYRTAVPFLTWITRKEKPVLKRLLVGSVIAMLAIVSLVLINNQPTLHFWKIRQPVILELHNRDLFALNQERQLLWIYHLPSPFDESSLSQKITDLNGDGREEVLVAGNYISDEKPSSELFCLNQSGKLLWRYRPGKRIKTPLDEFSNNYVIRAFEASRLVKNSSEKSIIILANHATWYPTQISVLNGRGQLTGEYWNAGYLSPESLIIEDVDGDGRKEIILGGTNNDFQTACVLVLDPKKISGCSPSSSTPEYQFQGLEEGTQEYYILLPRTTLNQTLVIRNYVRKIEISREDRNLEVTTTEYSKDIDYEMKYNFDFQFNPIFSRPVDLMADKIKEMVVSGLLPPQALTELKILKSKIRFWNGQAWVYKPERNKKLDF
ncbi:MAG: hypothetical protein ACP5P6_11350 [Candidatus Saccharicenans sp.]